MFLTVSKSIAQNKNHDLYLQYVEAANNRDFDAIKNMINDEVLLNGKKSKKEDAIVGFKWVLDNVPNHLWNIEDLFVQDDRIAARLRNTGTPKKVSFYGQNKKGKSVEFTEFASYKMQNGKFVEMWYLIDVASVIEQLKN